MISVELTSWVPMMYSISIVNEELQGGPLPVTSCKYRDMTLLIGVKVTILTHLLIFTAIYRAPCHSIYNDRLGACKEPQPLVPEMAC